MNPIVESHSSGRPEQLSTAAGLSDRAWDDSTWSSWSGDIQLRPARHYRPKSRNDLIGLVREAEQADPPYEVHASGSHWAFSAPAATHGFAVETTGLARTLDTDITHSLRPQPGDTWSRWQTDQLGVSHVEAGVIVHELCLRLDGLHPGVSPVPVGPPEASVPTRWALPTMGGSSGQTLLGAISTSTHGCDVRMPPLADAVRAIHLIGPGGREHWIERSAAITSETVVQQVYPGIEVHYDDDLLAAAVVSVGRFGIVYSVLLDVVPQFSLVTRTVKDDWAGVTEQLRNGDLPGKSRACQIVVSPYADHEGSQGPGAARSCYVTTRDRDASPVGRVHPQTIGRLLSRVVNSGGTLLRMLQVALLLLWLSIVLLLALDAPAVAIFVLLGLQGLVLGVLGVASGRAGDVVGRLCKWADRHHHWRWTAWLVRRILGSAQRTATTTGVGFQVMAGPPWGDEYYRGNSVELFFDATGTEWINVVNDSLLPIIEQEARHGNAIVGWFSIRFTGRTQAMLGMQQWDRTASIEVAVLRGIPGSVEVLRQLERAAVQEGGLVHWGQQNNVAPERVARSFPRLADWRARLASLSRTEDEGRTFENDYCRMHGLTLP